MSRADRQIVAPSGTPGAADVRQAHYFLQVLRQQRAETDDELADLYAALAELQENGDEPATSECRRAIRARQREQSELDFLLAALDYRFGVRRGGNAQAYCYGITVIRQGRWWIIDVPELTGRVQARRRAGVEVKAREFIAVSTGTPIADVAVQVVAE